MRRKGITGRLKERGGQMVFETVVAMIAVAGLVSVAMFTMHGITAEMRQKASNCTTAAQSSIQNLNSAVMLYKADVGHFPAGFTASEICPMLTKKAVGANGKEVGPWMDKCEEKTPWGETIMFDAESGVVYAKTKSGKYLTTVDLSAERDSWR